MFTLSSSLQRAGQFFGRRPAMPQSGRDWAAHLDRVQKAGRLLLDKGIQPGDRFAILALNSEAQAELLHAGYWIGAVAVPINWRLAPLEISALLEDCRPKCIFVDPALEPLANAPELTAPISGAVFLDRSFSTAINAADPAPYREASPDDDALLLYTGGTTGRAKGVRLTHGNIVANALQVVAPMRFTEDSRFFHVAPMFHSADLLGTPATLLGGGHVFLGRFTPTDFLSIAREFGATVTMLAPTMVRMVVEAPDKRCVPSLETLIYGSAPMDADLIRTTCAFFPDTSVVQGYGLTETAPLLAILGAREHRAIADGNDALAKLAGRALPGVDLRIDGDPVGEVLARGPNVSPGYFERPDDMAAAFEDGWFRTGDVGRIDEEGYLRLLDRAKDMIVTGGENVYSVEVEKALMQHDAVGEAAVIGVPDPKWGEAVAAFIVPNGKAPETDDLKEHCRERLGGYKVPRHFRFQDQLPRNALGKVLKHQLRSEWERQA